MSSDLHLLISFAGGASPPPREALQGLALPHLRALLSRMTELAPDAGSPQDLSPPHERVLARALGLWAGDGRTPWAAWSVHRSGGDPGDHAWAWLTPCHWQVGRDRVIMGDPAALHLSDQASRELLAAMRPYFEEDGLQLEWLDALQWRARGELFRDLACASLDRMPGATVDDWLARSPQARPIRRLQQEMQMLLYTHPANAEREAQGLAPVNSFWVSGAGAMPRPAPVDAPAIRTDNRLRDAALRSDAAAWAGGWREIDAEVLPPLLDACRRGDPVRLTLCGTGSARSWQAVPGGWARRLTGWLRPAPDLVQVLESL